MSPDLAIPASPAALRNEGSGFLPLTAKAASFSGIGYASGSGETLCMGQYQGGFALCRVTGVEILDQNFQRVNPIEIEAPTRGYVRMTLPGSTSSTVQRKVRIEREGGPVITPDTPVTLSRVGASAAYLAPITLKPEGPGASAAAPFAALEPIPELTIALGPNNAVVTNPDGGGVDASCGVDFPALLQLRFLKRDGTGLTDPDPSDPDHIPGIKQETAIGGKDEEYAEIVKVEIQAVHKDDPAVFCAFCTAEVGIKETPNGSYDTSTRLFYSDGSSGSTKLSSDGRINGQFVKLDGGRKVVELKAVLDVRRGKDSHKPTPTVVTGKAAYEGLSGAKVTAVGTNKRQTKSGSEQYISHWVDERSYVRKRGQALDPNDVNQYWVPHGSVTDCGGGRDWLEKKIKDCYADWMGDAEVEAGMGRVAAVLDTNDPDSKAVATAGPYEKVNGHPKTAEMTWTLWHPGVRRPAKAAEIDGYNYDQAGFQVKLAPAGDPAKDNFMQTAIHEARHAWQYTLADTSGRADEDDDYMFPEPPASATVLRDARLGSGNAEYDALGELLFDFAAWGDAAYGTPTPIITAPKEADAIRTSARLVSGQASNLVGCRDSGYDLAPVSRVGSELHVLATWKGRSAAAPQPFEGAAVRFDVVSGNMLLSEYVDAFMSRAETWAAPNTGNPGALLRVADASVVSRVRYTDGSKATADARVLVVPPSSGQAAMTRVSATLILPPECAGTTVTRSFDFNP